MNNKIEGLRKIKIPRTGLKTTPEEVPSKTPPEKKELKKLERKFL
jgi:hypothetical protein